MTDTIAVLAAQGRSGRACVQALLQAGYRVRAGVRSKGTFAPHPLLDEIPCDVLDQGDVARLLDGASAVVSMIGHNRRSSPTVQSTAIRHCLGIIAERQPDTRLVSLTGTGVRLPGDRIPLLDRAANAAIALVDPKRIADGKEHVRLLQEGPAGFTILRVLKLVNGPHHGGVRLTPHGPAELFTPRARVAAAVVQVLREGSFARQLPVISGGSHP
ncbi:MULTISPECIES: NAD(P)H-binding protein [Arthrobacter]|uniref:NAD(P)H-binding protein n=2 Tax=Arthrobacter TaxID=1663 RepID=A0ABU9KQ45_9MICC|nr:NAD(P)H-binding protein [Arthrobacter sp. YJM1]MDP5228234.1 NAD(P)H-binding protein [Arthrobacter sp. YJM1]